MLIKKSYIIIFAILAGFALYACSDNPVSTDNDDHADAVGFAILLNNAEILRFENNQYNYNPGGTWDDYFRVIDGETHFVLSPDVVPDMTRGMTPTVTLRWIDEDGNLFDLPEEKLPDGSANPEGEWRLEWDWEKPLVLDGECTDEKREMDLNLIRPSNLEQHGSDGSWGFHFRADHAGSDRIRFHLLHGDHADFTSGWMTIVVAHDDHELIDENGVWNHDRNKCRVR